MSTPAAEATTGHRTHRYLRLSLVVIMVAIGISVGVEIIRDGGAVRESVSAYYYSPVRNVFVGGLLATALVLVALSGRDRASAVLNVAAIFAPLIAIVPTGVEGRNVVPEGALADVHNGIWTYGCVVLLVSAIAVALVIAKQVAPRGILTVSAIAVAVVIALWCIAFVPPLNDQFPFNPALGISVHFLVTIIFFGAFIVVALLNALPREREVDAPPLTTGYRIAYLSIPILLVLVVIVMFVADRMNLGVPVIFIGEATALALFAAFWVIQTIERWAQPNQQSILAPR